MYTFRYGTLTDGVRASAVHLMSPPWTLTGPLREVNVDLLSITPTGGDVDIQELGKEATRVSLELEYRAYQDSATALARMNEVRALQSQPLQFFVGEEHWDTDWYMRNLNIAFNTPASPQPDVSTQSGTTRGGIKWITVGVSFELVGKRPTIRAG